MPRVVGSDPGTSGLHLVLLEDGKVEAEARFEPGEAGSKLIERLESWKPIDLAVGPSGHGLPLIRGEKVGESEIDEMALVRPDERGRNQGVLGFRSWVRAWLDSGVPVVFTPGGIHLPTIPEHRKLGAIDLGTADKVAVTALALWDFQEETGLSPASANFAVVEIGSAFSAILLVENGRIVDTAAGTRGPIGFRSRGSWDGEVAYLSAPLRKQDLFRGGIDDLGPFGMPAFRESLLKHAAGLKAITNFDTIYLSGAKADAAGGILDDLAKVRRLRGLPGASSRHAAQGAAILADGLAGGDFEPIVESLAIRSASGTSLSRFQIYENELSSPRPQE